MTWQHVRLDAPTSIEDSLTECTYQEAQMRANFVMLEPQHLPSDLSEVRAVMRIETPPEPTPENAPPPRRGWTASHRIEASGGGRRLSIKQFLYDWAPPAYDHPSLWRAPEMPNPPEEFPRPHEVANAIAWTGVNFRGEPAASLILDRTTIEVTVLDGTFDCAELVDVFHALKPVDRAAREQILNTPLSALCYQSRHRVRIPAVPLSFWHHERDASMTRSTYAGDRLPSALSESIAGADAALAVRGYQLDSVFASEGADGRPLEAHFLFYGADGAVLHVLMNPPDSPLGVSFPPRQDDQPARRTTIDVGGRSVYHGCLFDSVGPHEFVFRGGSGNVLVLVKPTPGTNLANATQLLGELMAGLG